MMKATIKTLEVTLENKTVPLTKAMAHQMDWFTPSNWTMDDLEQMRTIPLCEVALTDGVFVLIQTPHGIQKIRAGNLPSRIAEWAKANKIAIDRAILIK